MIEEHNKNLEDYRAKRTLLNDLHRAMSEHGLAMIKIAMLINGGAAVALLAFVQNTLPNEDMKFVADYLTNAFDSFLLGVYSAGLGLMTGYISIYGNYISHKRAIKNNVDVEDITFIGIKKVRITYQSMVIAFRGFTYLIFAFSLMQFGDGISNSNLAFNIHIPSTSVFSQ